jgi:hypothetical protein
LNDGTPAEITAAESGKTAVSMTAEGNQLDHKALEREISHGAISSEALRKGSYQSLNHEAYRQLC